MRIVPLIFDAWNVCTLLDCEDGKIPDDNRPNRKGLTRHNVDFAALSETRLAE
ncbi:hypothetical protein CHS0354_014386, partial [Potamilus streckersoni]